jgi:hypothetical protein
MFFRFHATHFGDRFTIWNGGPNPVGELGTETNGIFMDIQGNYVSWQDRMIHRIIDILTIVSAWGPKTKEENQPLNGS